MRHLNYNHLLYFWTVAKEGGVVKASELLHLTPQTISGQLKRLDEAVGEPLFRRAGRRLVLSDMGKMVFQYADEIFSLGRELAQVVRGLSPAAPAELHVGVTDSLPKLIAYRMLEPALSLPEPVRVVCREARLEPLLAELAVHRLDLVLSDAPVPPGLNVRAYNHLLGRSGVSFFAAGRDAKRESRRFPDRLAELPMLLPASGTPLRFALDQWFERLGIAPRVIAEFEDSALLKTFGRASRGVFPGATAIEDDICSMYRVAVIGRTDAVEERFYAISPERKLKHPAVVAISQRAQTLLET
jgi:LysR family transcriptional activator of nhaA